MQSVATIFLLGAVCSFKVSSSLNPGQDFNDIISRMSDRIENLERIVNSQAEKIVALDRRLYQVQSKCCPPPSIENGYPVGIEGRHPERSHGAVVRYACRGDRVLVGAEAIRCLDGEWHGDLPECMNRLSDTIFTLKTNQWKNMICYSDEHFQEIEFSRVPGAGKGVSLPENATTKLSDQSAVLDFSAVHGPDAFGVYRCSIKNKKGYAEIVAPWRIAGIYSFSAGPTIVSNIGEDVKLNHSAPGGCAIWRHNGEPVPSWNDQSEVVISNVQTDSSGIYECFHEERSDSPHALMRLIVRKCGKDLYGSRCDKKCPLCDNGGVCQEQLGTCVCPPGFTGNNCENACDKHRFGANCSKQCTGSGCGHQMFCLPDPYGCSCAAGYKGFICSDLCTPGWYGADCKQSCHCAGGGQRCDRYTGACQEGCSPGWTGQSCQIKECEPGWYGRDCDQPCLCVDGAGTCNPHTGACSGGCHSCGIRDCNTNDLKSHVGLHTTPDLVVPHLKSLDNIVCNPGYAKASAPVICNNGSWLVTKEPCTEENFDLNFAVVAPYPRKISCYSSKNGRNIEIFRWLEAGQAEGLPRNSTVTYTEDWAWIDLSRVISSDRYGLYGCQLCRDSSEAIVIPIPGSPFYFDYLTLVANRGDTVNLRVSKRNPILDKYPTRWLRNGFRIRDWDGLQSVELRGVQRQDAGVYVCYDDNFGRYAGGVMRLIVRGCPKDLFGEKCDQKCPSCYNGGVCDDRKGFCVCPPGFTGIHCERACGANRYGGDCTMDCRESDCIGDVFCKPDPFGCTCFPGWEGLWCNGECKDGWYGAGCKQSCHCADGRSCDRFTGACTGGCHPGWTGQSCQIEV